ncbi:hypothetical protein NQ317_002710 [Molorchus minor]|uniref:Uncharacterized protein n=1 Tax=Molorchus minor TaxID=1323400 RepID=A0ABQ9K2L3_9CUCU|nr:hypothetical protein NQ317_002710 [Molorchus minor]
MLACFCLNILIETGNDFKKVTPESLNLTDEERKDSFFKQDIRQVGKLIDITKAHIGLVHTRNVGSWTVKKCTNCDCDTHAVNQEKGLAWVIINSKLMDDEAILGLKSSDLVSPVFNIVVNPNELGEEYGSYIGVSPYPEIEPVLGTIRQTLGDFLKMERIAVEDRIRTYREEQNEIFNRVKDRGYQEYNSFVKLLKAVCEQQMLDTTNSPTGATVSDGQATLTEITSGSSPLSTSILLFRVRNSTCYLNDLGLQLDYSSRGPDTSLRGRRAVPQLLAGITKGVFVFEEDEMFPNQDSATEDSEQEDARDEDGIAIPRSSEQRQCGKVTSDEYSDIYDPEQ